MTLNVYMKRFLNGLANGTRLSVKGKPYASATRIAIRQVCARLQEFQEEHGKHYRLAQVDFTFYQAFVTWLNERGYALNTVGKYINGLKCLLSSARSDGLPVHDAFRERRFCAPRMDIDSIYLSRDELQRMMSVSVKSLTLARDVFMVGVWTAQRVSDYRHIQPSDLQTVTIHRDGQLHEISFLTLTQRKTGARVCIPCCHELREILGRYPHGFPPISALKLNRDIKEVARLADIIYPVEVRSIQGGRPVCRKVPKYQLITSHTARRTGATLMYLASMEMYDIMKITGHRSPEMLRRYIRADTLDVAIKLALRYPYFD